VAAERTAPGLGEMTGVVQSWQRSDGGLLILRLSPAAWDAARAAGVLNSGPDRWPAPPGPGSYRRVNVTAGPGMAPGGWQLLDGAGEVLASGDIAV